MSYRPNCNLELSDNECILATQLRFPRSRDTYHGLALGAHLEERVMALLQVNLQEVERGQLGTAQSAAVAVTRVVVHLLFVDRAQPAATAGHRALKPAHLLTAAGGVGSGRQGDRVCQ